MIDVCGTIEGCTHRYSGMCDVGVLIDILFLVFFGVFLFLGL